MNLYTECKRLKWLKTGLVFKVTPVPYNNYYLLVCLMMSHIVVLERHPVVSISLLSSGGLVKSTLCLQFYFKI